jgi:serine/threonine protein kinase
VAYLGVSLSPATREVLLVTEYLAGGDLATILSSPVAVAEAPLPWVLRSRIARDALRGLVALHQKEVTHRDIKTENFLLADDWRCAVADYGFARRVDRTAAMTMCGTDEFMAPEILFGEVYDERADVFSFGVFLWELICRKSPGKNGFMERQPRTKFQLDFDALAAMAPADAPPSLVELATNCCRYEPEFRLTSEEALEWLSDLVGELEAAVVGDAAPQPEPPVPSAIQRMVREAKAKALAASLSPSSAAAEPDAEEAEVTTSGKLVELDADGN